MRLIVLLVSAMLTGCSVMRPYPFAEVGIGYLDESSSSVLLHEGCDYVTTSSNHPQRPNAIASCGGENPTGQLNFGLEFAYKNPRWWKPDRLVREHWSHPKDGKNGSRREIHFDEYQ